MHKYYRTSDDILRLLRAHIRRASFQERTKEEMVPILDEIGKLEGIDDFLDKIADETVTITEEEVLENISQQKHPALTMPPLF
jgi:nucleoside-triphosphatase THEP1